MHGELQEVVMLDKWETTVLVYGNDECDEFDEEDEGLLFDEY